MSEPSIPRPGDADAGALADFVRRWPRTRKAAAYPISWGRTLARSRSLQLIVAGLQLALFVAVASPDLFGVKGWRWMAALIAIYVSRSGSGRCRRARCSTPTKRYSSTWVP